MPKKNLKSQQAKTQSILGKRGFGSGLRDDDDTTKSHDPDYQPNDEELSPDSDPETFDHQGVFSLYVGVTATTAIDIEENDGETEPLSEHDLVNAVILTVEDQSDVQPPATKRSRLRALPTFSGAGRTSIYLKNKEMAKAANNCKKISAFFQPCEKKMHTCDADRTISAPVALDGNSPGSSTAEAVSHLEEVVVTEPDSIPVEDSDTQITSSNVDSNVESEPAAQTINSEDVIEEIPIRELLDITVDDEIEDLRPKTEELVKRLLKEAKKHKSYSATFKLQAVNDYLALSAKFARTPAVKNPQTRASLAVAKGVGKGPYFARQ
ncbi:hypothetical protein H0H93_013882, partial [Arthromyces matolae]